MEDWITTKLCVLHEFRDCSEQVPKFDAVVLIDCQRLFCDPQGIRGNDDTLTVANHISTVIPEFRRLGTPVYSIYSDHELISDNGEIDFFGYQPHSDDIVMGKVSSCAFSDPKINGRLESELRKNNHNNLLFMGFNATACLKRAVLEAQNLNFNSYVAADCIGNDRKCISFTKDPDQVRDMLRPLYDYNVSFVSSGDILANRTSFDKNSDWAQAIKLGENPNRAEDLKKAELFELKKMLRRELGDDLVSLMHNHFIV